MGKTLLVNLWSYGKLYTEPTMSEHLWASPVDWDTKPSMAERLW